MSSFRHCRHIKVDGTFCQAPALKERDYCRFHLLTLGRRIRMARAQARREPYHIVLPILEDINAVQVARMQVLDALGAGLLSEKRAGLFLFGLQQASSDLHSPTAAPRLGVYDEAIDTAPRADAYPNFEEDFDLPGDIDLSKPPEVVFPAPSDSAAAGAGKAEPSPYRSSPWHRVNPEDVELEEILITQGEEAYKKRLGELESQSWKQIARERREVDRSRQVMEAARRNECQWTSGTLREHYEKLWAEAAAKEKADKEELAAELAAARAMAAARKAPESTGADGAAEAVNQQTGTSET